MSLERGSKMTAPPLDSDLRDNTGDAPGTSKRICIATSEIVGMPHSGGIGTNYYHLARLLAERGHAVPCLCLSV